MSDAADTSPPETEAKSAYVKGRRGRLPGHGRVPGSGLQKGQKVTPPQTRQSWREMIATRGQPLELLADIARGKKIRVGPQAGPGEPIFVYPDLKDRIECAKILARKLLPDVQANEVSGPNGQPIQNEHINEDIPDHELARRIGAMLTLSDPDVVSGEMTPDGRRLSSRRPESPAIKTALPYHAATVGAQVEVATATDTRDELSTDVQPSSDGPNDAEPSAPARGQVLECTSAHGGKDVYQVRNTGPDGGRRDGPDVFELSVGDGGMATRGNFQHCLRIVQKKLGTDIRCRLVDATPATNVRKIS